MIHFGLIEIKPLKKQEKETIFFGKMYLLGKFKLLYEFYQILGIARYSLYI